MNSKIRKALADCRFGAHYGLSSDIARGLKSAKKRTFVDGASTDVILLAHVNANEFYELILPSRDCLEAAARV